MNEPNRHELPGGWWIAEVDVDLFGRVATYAVEGTPYRIVRTPTGWRAQATPTGRQRRAYLTRGTEDAGHAVRLLVRAGHLRPL